MMRSGKILIAVAAMTACSSGGYGPTGSGDPSPSTQSLSIRVGETKAIGTTGVTVTFLAVIEDSRCPANAVCVWAGNGRVALTLSSGYGSTKDVELNTTTEPQKTVFSGLRIALAALDPYPTGGPIEPDDYVANLHVEQD